MAHNKNCAIFKAGRCDCGAVEWRHYAGCEALEMNDPGFCTCGQFPVPLAAEDPKVKDPLFGLPATAAPFGRCRVCGFGLNPDGSCIHCG